MHKITIIGHLGRDPEMRYTPCKGILAWRESLPGCVKSLLRRVG